MLQHYNYPLKVWLTSVLLGSIGLFTMTYIYQRDMFINYNLISYFVPVTLCIALGAILFWLSFWAYYSRLVNRDRVSRTMLLLIAIVLALSNFVVYLMVDLIVSSVQLTTSRILDVLVSAFNPRGLPIITSFVAAIAFAVLIYPIHKAKPKETTA